MGGAPGATRTRGLQIRNLSLYPPELRGPYRDGGALSACDRVALRAFACGVLQYASAPACRAPCLGSISRRLQAGRQYWIREKTGWPTRSRPFRNSNSTRKPHSTIEPPCCSTSLIAALIVPPVASRSSA